MDRLQEASRIKALTTTPFCTLMFIIHTYMYLAQICLSKCLESRLFLAPHQVKRNHFYP